MNLVMPLKDKTPNRPHQSGDVLAQNIDEI